MVIFWAIPDKVKKSQVEEWANKIGFIVSEFREREGGLVDYRLVKKKKNKIGQPMKKVTKAEILALRKKGNSMYAIAEMLGVSRKTLYNRINGKKKKKQT